MNKHSKYIFFKRLLKILLFVQLLFGQREHYISGFILDSNSDPLYGANVILTNTYLGSTTDSTGYYKIENLEPGKYTIMVSYIGYKSQKLVLYITA